MKTATKKPKRRVRNVDTVELEFKMTELETRLNNTEADLAAVTLEMCDYWFDVFTNHSEHRLSLIDRSSLSEATISKYKQVGGNLLLRDPKIRVLFKCGIGLLCTSRRLPKSLTPISDVPPLRPILHRVATSSEVPFASFATSHAPQ